MDTTTLRTLALTTLLAAAALAAPAVGAQPGQPVPGAARVPALDELDCRALLRLGGDERGDTVGWLHGWVGGRRGLTQFPAREMAEATDRIVDHCIDEPDDKLLTVFERVRGE